MTEAQYNHISSDMAIHRHHHRTPEAPLAIEVAAQGFAACGAEPRLTVLRQLVRAGEGGLTVGQIQERTGIPPSTLAHHLRFLTAGGLVEQERKGRSVVNRAAYGQVRALAAFLIEECCADVMPSSRVHSARTALMGPSA